MKLPKGTNLPGQIGRGLFLVSCMGLAGVSAALGMVYAHVLDWTMMGIGMLCLTPVLIVLDIATMAVLAWSSVQTRRLRMIPDGPETAPADAKAALKETQLVRLTSLALVHLVTAGLAVFLLAALALYPLLLRCPGCGRILSVLRPKSGDVQYCPRCGKALFLDPRVSTLGEFLRWRRERRTE